MLTYPMGLRTGVPPGTAREVLRELSGLVPQPDGSLELDALTVTVGPVEGPGSVYDDVLGEPADLEVVWSVDAKADDDAYARARRTMAVASAVLSVRLDATSCLTYQLDAAVLRRVGGELVLYDWFPEWREPDVLAALPGPVRRTGEPGRL